MKRKDLQGLRGIAIFAVILFNFFPNRFPNGYLGVDVFFVLSGFLMTMILDRTHLNETTLLLFYYHRVKRIVPMYFLILLSITTAALFLFPSFLLSSNIESAIKSLLFIPNVEQSSQAHFYPELERSENLFAHIWSLSVEMQYYLIIPISYIAFSYAPREYQSLGYFIVCLVSLIFHYATDSNKALNNLVLGRIWQFSVGSIAYFNSIPPEKSDTVDEESLAFPNTTDQRNKYVTVVMIEVLLFVTFLHKNTLDQVYIRLTITLLTGMILLNGGLVSERALTSSIVVFMGDISYSLYLVHWPVYVYIRTFFEDELFYILGIVLSIAIATILTETYERFYLKASWKTVSSIIFALLFVNIMILAYSVTLLQNSENVTKIVQKLIPYNNDSHVSRDENH